MTHRSKWLGGLTGVALILISATAVLGYAAQVAGTVTLATVGEVTCTAPVSVSATVLETGTSSLIEGQPVNFAFTASNTGDKIIDTSVDTNALGVATTTVDLECTSGNRTIQAVADDIVGSAVLGLTFAASPSPAATARPAAGLPNTSTDGAEVPLLLTAAIALGSGGFLLRRYAFTAR